MSIVRVSKRERFVVMDKTGLEDSRLSFKAKGLLAYLLTKPDKWSISYRQLEKVGPDRKTVVLSALKELENGGYLHRERIHVNGLYDWEQVLYEVPLNAPVSGSLINEPEINALKINALKTGALSEEGKSEEGLIEEEPKTFAGFDEFWKIYPPRRGVKVEKKKAREQWIKLTDDQRLTAMTAVRNYADACRGDAVLAKDAFRWLRDETFMDWLTVQSGGRGVNDAWSGREEDGIWG